MTVPSAKPAMSTSGSAEQDLVELTMDLAGRQQGSQGRGQRAEREGGVAA